MCNPKDDTTMKAQGHGKTYAEKVRAYRTGAYVFTPPPVYAGNWHERDWIRYVFGPSTDEPTEAEYYRLFPVR